MLRRLETTAPNRTRPNGRSDTTRAKHTMNNPMAMVLIACEVACHGIPGK
jgi:hypothetical protein